jgi:hypothetical protein
MAVASSAMTRSAISTERVFFLAMTIAMFGCVFVGFSRSFFLHPFFPERHRPSESFFYVHGTIFAAWFVLLVVQASLVTAGNVRRHRQLGVAGVGLAAVMIVFGTIGALIAAHRPGGFIGVPVPPLVFLVVPLTSMLFLGGFVTLAIVNRGNPQKHKRFMLLASMSMIAAAFARWPLVETTGILVFFALADVFLIPLAIWDFRSRGRLHPVTLWGGLVLIASEPLQLALASTPAWGRFARWAVGLVA